MIHGGGEKCSFHGKNLLRNIWERYYCVVSFYGGYLGSFSTAGIEESSEQGAVSSRAVECCFCRELL